MKKLFFTLLAVLMAWTAMQAATVQINATNFPDANFRSHMLSLYPKGYMTDSDIAGLTSLDVSGKSISDMTGIEKLTALKKLNCYQNSLTSLNLNSNTALTLLRCWGNTKLTTLTISNCTNIDTLICFSTGITSLSLTNHSKLKYFDCYNTKLTRLTLTEKSQLKKVIADNCTALADVSVYNNSALTHLYLSGNTAMTYLACYNNALTTLNVTGDTALGALQCQNNSNLATITGLAECTAIGSFNCRQCAITDLSACNNMPNLTYLYCSGNKITNLTLTGSSKLYYVEARNNTALTEARITGNSNLELLNIDGCTALKSLYCYSNALTKLNLTGNTALTKLTAHSNANLAEITGLADCKAMAELSCSYCSISDLSACNSMNDLGQLTCIGNKITSLTLTDKPKLTYVGASDNTSMTWVSITGNNALVSLFMDGCTALKTLDCHSNALNYLFVTGDTALEMLICFYNHNLPAITGLADCTAITSLDCEYCALTDLSACDSMTNLKKLYCTGNKIKELTLIGKSKLTEVMAADNTALTSLYCCENALTALNVSGCTALTDLFCFFNRLTSLNVQDCNNLSYIDCTWNNLDANAMTAFVNSLPARTADAPGELVAYSINLPYDDYPEFNVFNGSHASIAHGKYWKSYYYDATNNIKVEIVATQPGDVDGNGTVNIADVTVLIDLLLGGGDAPAGADMDGNGMVNIADVTALIDYLLGGN